MNTKLTLIIAGMAATWAAWSADVGLKATSPLIPVPEKQPLATSNQAPGVRAFVKEWKVNDLVSAVNNGLKGGRSFERGKTLFTEASCSLCHHFGPDGGGVGPDLTGASGTFAVRDLLEAIIEPSKQISSLYGTTIVRLKNGETLTGWIPEETDDTVSVMQDMLAAGTLTVVNREDIESMKPSPISLMPDGLLNTLKQDEILDLMAFLLSSGDSKQKMFR